MRRAFEACVGLVALAFTASIAGVVILGVDLSFRATRDIIVPSVLGSGNPAAGLMAGVAVGAVFAGAYALCLRVGRAVLTKEGDRPWDGR